MTEDLKTPLPQGEEGLLTKEGPSVPILIRSSGIVNPTQRGAPSQKDSPQRGISLVLLVYYTPCSGDQTPPFMTAASKRNNIFHEFHFAFSTPVVCKTSVTPVGGGVRGKGLRGEWLSCGHSIYQQQGVRPTRSGKKPAWRAPPTPTGQKLKEKLPLWRG